MTPLSGHYYWVKLTLEEEDTNPEIMRYCTESFYEPVWWAIGTEQHYDTDRVVVVQGPIEFKREAT